MPKYLVKYSMAAYWEEEVEAEDMDEAIAAMEYIEITEDPKSWEDYSIDSVVDLETGEEHEITSTLRGVEIPNRYKKIAAK